MNETTKQSPFNLLIGGITNQPLPDDRTNADGRQTNGPDPSNAVQSTRRNFQSTRRDETETRRPITNRFEAYTTEYG